MCGNLILPTAMDYVYFYMKLNLRNILYVIEGYTLQDGTKLMLSEKDQMWLGLNDTFSFKYNSFSHNQETSGREEQ